MMVLRVSVHHPETRGGLSHRNVYGGSPRGEQGQRRSRVVMGDVVNLKRFRKRIERAHAEQRADENRVRHGRTRSERERDEVNDRKLREKLDQHRIGEEDR